VVRLPFTRVGTSERLSTPPMPTTRFSEPEDVLPISATTTTHGHRPRAASLPRAASGGDEPPRAFALDRPLTGTIQADEPRRYRLPGGACLRDRASSSEGSRRLSTDESPPRTGSAHLSVMRAPLREADPLAHRARTVWAASRANARAQTTAEASGSRIAPRRVMRSHERRGAFHRFAPARGREDRSPRSYRWASLPRSTCAPKSTDALQHERACAFSTTP